MTVDGDEARVTLEHLYRDTREELYRALVIITRNRDIATEAIDRGYRSWHQQLLPRRRARSPQAQVLARALRWARRRAGGDAMRGFRLPGPELGTRETAVAQAIADLEIEDRAALVATSYLGWGLDETAAALGVEPAAVSARIAATEEALAAAAGAAPEDIAAALSADASGYAEPLSRFEAVRAESVGRRIGAAIGALTLTLGVVGGGIVLIGSLGSDGPGGESVAAGGTGAAGTTVAPDLVELDSADIEWTQVALPIRQGDTSSVAHGPSGFIVVAQDYSGPQPRMQLLQSDDGAEWVTFGELAAGQNTWVHQIQAVGDTYVAVGSGFDERNGRDRPLVWISDDGSSWSRADIPVETTADIAGLNVDLYTWINAVTSTSSGIALFGNQSAEMDLQPLIEAALPEDVTARNGWGTSPRGIEVYDGQGRVTYRAAWDELEIDPALVQLMSGGRPVLWTSPDGLEWTMRALEVGNFFGGIGNVAITDDAAAALVWGEFGATIWTGPLDGKWEPANLAGLANASGVAAIGSRLIVVGASNDGGNAGWVSTDGATWDRIEDPDLAGNLWSTMPSTGAVVVVGDDGPGQQAVGPAVVTLDAGTLEVTSNGLYTLTGDDGTPILSVTADELEYDGPDIVLVDPETGDVVATVAQEEIDLAWELEFRSAEFEGRGFAGEPNRFLLVTTDGLDWTRIELDELATGFYPSGAAYSSSTIVLTGFQEMPEFGGASGPSVWVGTIGG